MNTPQTEKASTINDVARAVGVSKSTISRALAGQGYFSAETRQAIEKAVAELNYRPNGHAQRLSQGGDSNTIALFALMLDRGVITQKLQAIARLLEQKGYAVPYHEAHDADLQVSVLSMLRSQHPRAIVCNAKRLAPPAVAQLQRYQKEGGTIVAYDSPLPELNCDKVVFDREENTYLATRHLIDLGHTRIGYYRPPHDMPMDDRTLGYLRALQESGLAVDDRWIYEVSFDEENSGGTFEDAGWVLAKRVLAQTERPTAMVITNDYAAAAFAATLGRAGLRVPCDVSVVGSDDAPIARHGALLLTTVTHPIEQIAHHVVELLIGRLEGYSGATRTITVRGELVVRESTLPLRPQKRKAILQDFEIAPSEAGLMPVSAGRNGRSSS